MRIVRRIVRKLAEMMVIEITDVYERLRMWGGAET